MKNKRNKFACIQEYRLSLSAYERKTIRHKCFYGKTFSMRKSFKCRKMYGILLGIKLYKKGKRKTKIFNLFISQQQGCQRGGDFLPKI